jgi:predicted TPR repeat methyltransferase
MPPRFDAALEGSFAAPRCCLRRSRTIASARAAIAVRHGARSRLRHRAWRRDPAGLTGWSVSSVMTMVIEAREKVSDQLEVAEIGAFMAADRAAASHITSSSLLTSCRTCAIAPLWSGLSLLETGALLVSPSRHTPATVCWRLRYAHSETCVGTIASAGLVLHSLEQVSTRRKAAPGREPRCSRRSPVTRTCIGPSTGSAAVTSAECRSVCAPPRRRVPELFTRS